MPLLKGGDLESKIFLLKTKRHPFSKGKGHPTIKKKFPLKYDSSRGMTAAL